VVPRSAGWISCFGSALRWSLAVRSASIVSCTTSPRACARLGSSARDRRSRAVADDPQAQITRVLQVVIVGIGFLGAGITLHRDGNSEVRRLTTAAAIWITAFFGILCGLAAWPTAAVAIILTAILLTLGGPFERWCHRHFGSDRSMPSPDGG